MSPFPGAPHISLSGWRYNETGVCTAALLWCEKLHHAHSPDNTLLNTQRLCAMCTLHYVISARPFFGIPLAICCIAIQIATQRFHNVKQQ